ncbi:unnamed protein product [Amoebophrya sp. A120]|nr:unnamed protein product [Amoebophrya sp. A120]|eukprot:GSA120T00017328001.1
MTILVLLIDRGSCGTNTATGPHRFPWHKKKKSLTSLRIPLSSVEFQEPMIICLPMHHPHHPPQLGVSGPTEDPRRPQYRRALPRPAQQRFPVQDLSKGDEQSSRLRHL